MWLDRNLTMDATNCSEISAESRSTFKEVGPCVLIIVIVFSLINIQTSESAKSCCAACEDAAEILHPTTCGSYTGQDSSSSDVFNK